MRRGNPIPPMRQSMNITDGDFEIEAPLALPEDEVQLWRADLAAIRENESRWQKLLSSDESNRAERFHFPADRQRFVASRALLRLILAGYLGTDPKRLIFSYSKQEKPSLAADDASGGITFNVSHSAEIALFAFTRRREIGVDVEEIRCDFEVETIANRFFSAKEKEQLAALPNDKKFEAFFRCWTRKEAYIKATGDGLSLALHQFDVSILAQDTDALIATRPDHTVAALWSLREIPAGVGHVAALCVRGRDWQMKNWSAAG